MVLDRSQQMARIKARNTLCEVLLCNTPSNLGVHFTTGVPVGACHPDLVLVGRPVAVFIDGCFWHGCPEHYVRPRTRGDFWAGKLRENTDRDRRQTLALEREGWHVVRIWEHAIVQNVLRVAESLASAGRSNSHSTPDWRVVSVLEVDDDDCEVRVFEDLREPKISTVVSQPRTTK